VEDAVKTLVTYGSERGGTKDISSWVADALREDGLDVDLIAARDVRDLRPYEAVVVGGALYMFHWHADARSFVLRHAQDLRAREVYFFSSGPLDDAASQGEMAPVPQVADLMGHVGARAHATFGGRLASDAHGFPASAMAKTKSGDWRDRARVDAWAHALAATLRGPRVAHVPPRPLPSRAVPVALCLFAGVSALGGGAMLIASPDGGILHLPLRVLAHSPFGSFLVPGMLLFTLVGLLSAYAAWQHLARARPFASLWSFAAGCSLTIWIVTEMVMLHSAHWLQLGYLALATAMLFVSAVGLRRMFAMVAAMQREAAKVAPRPA
jgi:menaquinone-dependent protoporphyrinogen oxidase